MIKTNLIISIAEDAVAGDAEAVTIKTTSVGNIIVEMHCPKIAIKIEDLKNALVAVEEFISKRPIVIYAEAQDSLAPTFEFDYQPEAETKQIV